MRFLTDTDEIDIEIFSLVMDIDIIFHKNITDKTGITVSHRDIQNFIIDIIKKNNKRQLETRRRDKEFDEKYEKKIKQGKTITDLNSIKNIINYYIFNYVLIRPSGCGTTPDDIMQCEDCNYEYGSEECKRIRKDNGYLPAHTYNRFI